MRILETRNVGVDLKLPMIVAQTPRKREKSASIQLPTPMRISICGAYHAGKTKIARSRFARAYHR
jgi:energy-converting hydrogenase Eha subunit A